MSVGATKQCPYCAETIQNDALKCKHCGEWLNKPMEAIDQVQPWTRYFARYMDYIIFGVAIGILIEAIWPGSLENANSAALGVGIIFLWNFVEAAFLSNWGTTPGKKILNIQVQDLKGGNLDFSEALNRSFSVWLSGLGLGIPVINLIVMLVAYNSLKKEKISSWDRGKSTVVHGRIGPLNVITAVAVFVIFFFLVALGSES